MRGLVVRCGLGLLLSLLSCSSDGYAASREQLIPILGTTAERQPSGSVGYIVARFEERTDHDGLLVRFHARPGKFSRMAQASTEEAIRRTARSLGLTTDSWTVDLRIPHEGVTMYGNSLSAMIGLTVAAMAQGKNVPSGYVLTGTVTHEGGIGPVGSIPLKVQAANAAKLRRVLIPEQSPTTEGLSQLSPMMQVSPVRSVPEAFEALTNASAVK